jgi:arsenate reductase-like glutaredoxin family protein
LRELGIEVDEVNYAKAGLDPAAVRAVVEAAGSVAAVLNKRHAVAKERGWTEKPPALPEFAAAVAEDPNLLRRPILVRGKTVLVGFDKTNREAWSKLAP